MFWHTRLLVALRFQSLRSSSSGNCLLLTCDGCSLLIDCGFKSQRECRAVLAAHAKEICGVIVSHAHGDHICYPSLRALGDRGTAVHCHIEAMPHLERSHARGPCNIGKVVPFGMLPFTLGQFDIQAVPLPHAPGCPTFGFAICAAGRKAVVCTDFNSAAAMQDHLLDADFVFIESNHDVELLRRYPNWGSYFHMSNDQTAAALSAARRERGSAWGTVMLGHLSEQRNDADLALKTVQDHFSRDDAALDFDLLVAPRMTPSRIVEIC